MPPSPERRPNSEYGTCTACENAAAHDKLMQLSQPWNPLRRPTWQSAVVTSVGAFIVFLANQLTTLLVGFYPLYAKQSLGASELQISALFSIYPICIMVACPAGSYLTTRLGRNAVICLGLFVSGLSTIWFAYCTSVNILVVLRGIQGLGAGMSIVGSVSMITEQATMLVTTAISITELVVAVAFVTAPAIGSILVEWGGVSLPFLASGLCQLACLMVIPSLFVEYGLPDGLLFQIVRPGSDPKAPLRFADVLTSTSLVCLMVTTVVMGGFGVVDPTLGTHLQHSLGAHESAIGIGFSVSALVYVVGDYAFTYLTTQCGCKPIILGGLTCLSASFLCLGVPSLVGIYEPTTAKWGLNGIALVLLGCGSALAIAPGVPLSLASLTCLGLNLAEARPLLIGLFGGAVYFGQAVGPWFAWVLCQVVPLDEGSPLPWVFTVYGISVAVVWLYVFTCLPSGQDIHARVYERSFSLQRQVSEYGQFVSIDDDGDPGDDDNNNRLLSFEGGSYGSMSPQKPF
ncbi:hypothetical protein DYB32_004786 [Aphanomyces invadans]|uniref:Major facilitator superfamily (MFS) profile domain-containing protein n=1 Tax=Aphanomyces invadans TaxID=157072 RepID=A0A3R6ZQK4_9STRA|nr:hypothetical protein DYB32_004786 [Aphanomyces invadans]